MRMKLLLTAALTFSATLLYGDGAAPMPAPAAARLSPAEQAIQDYNAGLRHRDKAWKIEKELEKADAAKQAKLNAKIADQYKAAIRDYRKAIDLNPNFYQVHSELGYALRKTGDYQTSLAAYDKALTIEPRYAEAIEYRAETYLWLNRLDDAKQAYTLLFQGDRQRADLLAAAMRKWVDQRRVDAAGVAPEMIEEFDQWLSSRESAARQTAAGAGASWR